MLQSIEAVVDQNGVLRLIDPVELPRRRHVIITFLDEEPTSTTSLAELESIPLAINQPQNIDIEEQLKDDVTDKDFLLSIAGTFESGVLDKSLF